MAERSRLRADDVVATVEITPDGYLRVPVELAVPNFPNDRCAGLRTDDMLALLPATVYAPNALIMKQRTLAGERSVLIREVWGDDHPVGTFVARWQAARRRLVIEHGAPSGAGTAPSPTQEAP